MDKLSNLIQEARPLYKRKKRQRAILKATFMLLVPVIVGFSALGLYTTGNELYLSMEDNSLQQEIINDDMGLLR